MMAARPAQQRGFTLMEVLIAVSITSIIGIGVWQVVNNIIKAREGVDEIAVQFEGIQKLMLMLERDLGQIVNRPVRNIYGDFEPAFSTRQDGFGLGPAGYAPLSLPSSWS